MKTVTSPAARTLRAVAFYAAATFLVVLWLLPLVIGAFTSLKSMDELMSDPVMWRAPRSSISRTSRRPGSGRGWAATSSTPSS